MSVSHLHLILSNKNLGNSCSPLYVYLRKIVLMFFRPMIYCGIFNVAAVEGDKFNVRTFAEIEPIIYSACIQIYDVTIF